MSNERNRKTVSWDTIRNLCAVLGAVAALSGVIAVGTWFFGIPYRVGTLEGTVRSNTEWRYRHELEASAERVVRDNMERRLAECERKLAELAKLKP
jgi:hypothetical protein